MGAHVAGIDVAGHQGAPDWTAVRAAGFRFVYVKATEGVGYVSPTLDQQLAGARGAGMVTGLYHYARPDTNAAEQDAAEFAAQLARLDSARVGDLPPCVDVETGGGDLAKWVATFVDALRGHTGRRTVMVYASASWFTERLAVEQWADPDVVLWVAHHGRPPGQPGYRSERVVLHQHASDGRVDGIDAVTDLNVALTELSTLTGDPDAAAGRGVGGQRADSYVVQPGDTLSGIGARLGVDWQEIARVNGVSDPDLIYVGEVLRVP